MCIWKVILQWEFLYQHQNIVTGYFSLWGELLRCTFLATFKYITQGYLFFKMSATVCASAEREMLEETLTGQMPLRSRESGSNVGVEGSFYGGWSQEGEAASIGLVSRWWGGMGEGVCGIPPTGALFSQ